MEEKIENYHESIENGISGKRKIPEKSLMENQISSYNFYKALADNSLDIKITVNDKGEFVYVSSSVKRILGYPPNEIKSKSILNYIHRDDIRRIVQIFSELRSEPNSIDTTEFRLKDSEGDWHYFQSIMKNLLEDPDVNGILINLRDITKLKDAENTVNTLLNISEKLNATLDVDHIMDVLTVEGINLIGSESGCSGLRTAEGMMCKKIFLSGTPEIFEYCWSPDQGIPGKVITTKDSFLINDAKENQNTTKEFIDRFGINNLICVPIVDSENEVMGFLEVMNKSGNFTENDLNKLSSLAQIASITIRNALAYQKIKLAQFQVKNSREQLRRLSAHLQNAREEERTRIAREIHDELGQALTGLKMDISWINKKMLVNENENEPFINKLKTMSNLVDATIKTVRKISSELRPGVLDYLGLSAAIEWQAQEFQNRTGIYCNIITLPKDMELDQERSTAIFRIFQETLTNVTRHAEATQIDVRMEIQGNKLILMISDNGKGITDSEIKNTRSFGLLGMRERTHLLGGEFSIKGIPNLGTTVTVEIPLDGVIESGGTL